MKLARLSAFLIVVVVSVHLAQLTAAGPGSAAPAGAAVEPPTLEMAAKQSQFVIVATVAKLTNVVESKTEPQTIRMDVTLKDATRLKGPRPEELILPPTFSYSATKGKTFVPAADRKVIVMGNAALARPIIGGPPTLPGQEQKIETKLNVTLMAAASEENLAAVKKLIGGAAVAPGDSGAKLEDNTRAVDGAKTTATAEQIDGWIKNLDNDRFGPREDAIRKLYEAGAASVDALSRAAGGDRLEATLNAIGILRRMSQSEQSEVKLPAKRALEQLSKSDDKSLAKRAAAALVRDPVAKPAVPEPGPDPNNVRSTFNQVMPPMLVRPPVAPDESKRGPDGGPTKKPEAPAAHPIARQPPSNVQRMRMQISTAETNLENAQASAADSDDEVVKKASEKVQAARKLLEEARKSLAPKRNSAIMFGFSHRFLVFTLMAIWWGGLTFYGAIVIPTAAAVLGSHGEVGYITQRVTDWLNLIGIANLTALAWNLAANWRNSPRWLRATAAATWLVMAAILAGLFALHPQLDQALDAAGHSIRDEGQFLALHRVYLIATTIQWFAGLVHIGCMLLGWPRAPLGQ